VKVGSLALDAGHREGAAHRLRQPPGQHQADAAALDLGVLGAEAVELGEQPRQLVGGDARTGVGDRDAEAAVVAVVAGEADAAAVVVVFDGVGRQVQQDLLEPLPGGLDGPGALRRGGRVDLQRPLGGQRPAYRPAAAR
jgi:hypothetical protein